MGNNGVRRWRIIENIAIYFCTAALIIGLFWMGAGLWSLSGFAMLFFVNMRGT